MKYDQKLLRMFPMWVNKAQHYMSESAINSSILQRKEERRIAIKQSQISDFACDWDATFSALIYYAIMRTKKFRTKYRLKSTVCNTAAVAMQVSSPTAKVPLTFSKLTIVRKASQCSYASSRKVTN